MSPEKKKKLEAAIDNLFSSSRPKGKKPQPAPEPAVEVPAAQEPVPAQPVEPPAPQPAPAVEAVPAVVEPVQPAPQHQPQEPAAVAPVPVPAPKVEAPVSILKPEDVIYEKPVSAAASSSAASQNYGTVQMVVFMLDNQYYGIGIEAVESIIKMQPITKLPFVPAYNIGLTNLRGKVLPVFSLRRRFGLADQEAHHDNRIIVTRLDKEQVGLMVDAVSEIVTVMGEKIEPAPQMATSSTARFVSGVANLGDRLVIMLDLEKTVFANL